MGGSSPAAESTEAPSTRMPRCMPRANIATTMGTRFPLVKCTYWRHDVAGTVKLLLLSEEDAPRAAQVKPDANDASQF